MTTPTNDRQTSEREWLFADDPPLAKLAAMLQALEFDPAAVNLSAEVLAVACRYVAGQAKDAAALRAENEALRTVTEEDVQIARDAFVGYENLHGYASSEAMLTALQSFIRSKESRRG